MKFQYCKFEDTFPSLQGLSSIHTNLTKTTSIFYVLLACRSVKHFWILSKVLFTPKYPPEEKSWACSKTFLTNFRETNNWRKLDFRLGATLFGNIYLSYRLTMHLGILLFNFCTILASRRFTSTSQKSGIFMHLTFLVN